MIPALPNILSVDVEDYFHVSAFEHLITRDQWPHLPCRIEASTDHLLQLFDDFNVQGTFFVLGWVAEHYPALVRRIANAGHEIASHGYWHQLVYQLTPDAFRKDLRDSVRAIGEATGTKVCTYRAPSFSITNQSLWALDVLADEGFTVDSSIFPIHHDRYGIPNARSEIHQIKTSCGTITEVPPSVGLLGLGKARFKVPIGGGYFRLFPLSLTRRAMQSVQDHGRPAMIYVHPWEFDPEQPRVPRIGFRTRFRHYVGLKHSTARMRWLLQNFSFAPMREVLESNPHSAARCLKPR